MGNSASKVKGDSPRLPSCHPWSKAPYGSWIIRFSPGGCATQKLNKMTEIKGLPLYQWSSPDWVTGDTFNTLMFVVVQIFLERSHNRLTRLLEEPLEAAEMIAQFNTFINSTNQDMRELQNQLLEAAHESIYLHVEDDQLRYLDLLITNEFDPQYQVRAVISRKSRSSKSSLLRSVTTTIKSKLTRKKNKGHQASLNPGQQSSPVPSNDLPNVDHTPLRPTAPWLSELNERTETVTTRDDVDNTNEFCEPGASDNSNINSTNNGDRESFRVSESRNFESTRKLEDKSLDIELNMPSSSLPLPSIPQTVTSAVVAFEQSPDELIAKQKGVSCMKVSPEASNDTYSSLTVNTEDEIMFQPKENSENEKNAGSYSCLQEDASEDVDVVGYVSDSVVSSHLQTWHAEAEEPDSSNSGLIYGNVPSDSICAESVEQSMDNVLAFSDVPFGSSENREDNGQVCVNVPSGSKHAESVEYRNDNGPPSSDVFSGLGHAELNEHVKDNDPPCTDVLSGSKHAEPFECHKDYGPLSTAVHSGSKQAESSENITDSGPTSTTVPSGSKQAESSEYNKDDGPTNSDAPSGTEQAESSEHSLENDPVCAEPNEEKDNNGPVCIDVPAGTKPSNASQHHSNNNPIIVMATQKKRPSNPCTFLQIYGLSKSCLRSTTQPDSRVAQEGSANVKEEKENHSAKPQVLEPSSRNFFCLPFHGLSKGSFSPSRQGASTGVQTQKQKADTDKADDAELAAKRLKLDDTSYRAEGKSDPCYSSAEGADCQSDTEITNPKSMTQEDAQQLSANVKKEKEEPGIKPRVHKPSSSSFVCIPIHGLSRGSFSPPQQGASTGVQNQKRKADFDEANGELAAKRLKLDDTSYRAEGKSDPCYSSTEGADCQSDTEISNPKSMTQQVSSDAQQLCANVKKKKEEPGIKPRVHKPSSSSFVCIPIHGLSRGSFSPPQQGASTGVQNQKRKADFDEANGELAAKRLKLDDTYCEAGEGEKSVPCHLSSESADCQSDTGMTNPRCNVDDTEGDDGNDSSSSESTEWHDALEDMQS